MKGEEIRLVDYMEGKNKRFVIPVYQRNYDWRTANCKQLYEDLVKVVRKRRKNHFFGSIVSAYDPEGSAASDEYQIIDGQQRLTTVSLLLLAIRNLLGQGKILSEDPNLRDIIYETYLANKFKTGDDRFKLIPIKKDRVAYVKLFDDVSEHIPGSNMTTSYDFFYNQVQKEDVSVDELFDAVSKLVVISIKLNQDDDPQLIFESLNSTGLDLAEGDKIRNYILMGLPVHKQEIYYEKYWNRIEENTDYQLDFFIRDYLSVKTQSTPALSKVYLTFKSYVESKEIEPESLLQDMLDYAKLYSVLLGKDVKYKDLRACIVRLNRLETTVTRPFFLEALRLHKEGVLTQKDVVAIFHDVESYLFRRSICDLPTNSLNKIFLALHSEIMRYEGTSERYFEKFKYALLAKKDKRRFPNDEEFAESFATKQIYPMNHKNRAYIFERIENFGTSEDKDVYRHIDDGDYTVEHIMPQHLSPAWADALGAEYEQIHETWLHRIANLTLTGYNPKYSNNTFEEKRDMANGFKDSGICMNHWIAHQDKWGEEELEKRTELLKKRALKIWEAPKTDYVPPEKPFDSCTLDEEYDLSGRKIARFAYKTMEQPVKSWAEMFESVVRALHSTDKSILKHFAYGTFEEDEHDAYISSDSNSLREPTEIDPGIYIEGNTSTQLKLVILRRLFALYGANPSDLVFYLYDDEDEEKAAALKGARHEIRKKYWDFALPKIKEVNAENGAFDGCNCSSQNWLNGALGVRRFAICCVANFSSARVEMVMDKIDRKQNIQAFNILKANKQHIEASLGTKLVWDLGENRRSAKVYYEISDVGIANENEWSVVANFHAKWAKKFYDVIVAPYLLPKFGKKEK